MSGIFISYRRDDTGHIARRLHEALCARLGAAAVFIDVVDIDAGEDFGQVIDEKVGFCDVVLALIGTTWSTSVDAAGSRRLDDPRDWLRLEIVTALTRGIRVIPVLVDGAALPAAGELAAPLAPLVMRQALPLRAEEFSSDFERLSVALQTLGAGRTNVSWLSLVVRRDRALDPLALNRPEVLGRALRFLLVMTALDQIIHWPAAPEVGLHYWRIVRVIGAAAADAVGWLALGASLHFAMRAVGGRGTLARSLTATCFLSAYLPLIGLAQAPSWGLNISVTADLSDPTWSPDRAVDKLYDFTARLGGFGVARFVVSFVLAALLWCLVVNALFRASRILHGLRFWPALAASVGGFLVYLGFLLFIWGPLLGSLYTALGARLGGP
jgi:hypothetical protein